MQVRGCSVRPRFSRRFTRENFALDSLEYCRKDNLGEIELAENLAREKELEFEADDFALKGFRVGMASVIVLEPGIRFRTVSF